MFKNGVHRDKPFFSCQWLRFQFSKRNGNNYRCGWRYCWQRFRFLETNGRDFSYWKKWWRWCGRSICLQGLGRILNLHEFSWSNFGFWRGIFNISTIPFLWGLRIEAELECINYNFPRTCTLPLPRILFLICSSLDS